MQTKITYLHSGKSICCVYPKRHLNVKRNIILRCLIFICCILSSGIGMQAYSQTQTQSFTSSGTFTVPAGVTSVTVEAWGGGGRGATRTLFQNAGGGGGGGAYSSKVIPVSPGSYTVTVGLGGTSATPTGGDSWFGTAVTVMAKGGGAGSGTTAGAAGSGASSIGDIKFNGGIGSTSGGGGSSAGTAANGNPGSGGTGATAPTGGGNGGATLLAGSAPGGGGGSGAFSVAPGNGGNGKVNVTYTAPPPVVSVHPLAQNLGAGATISLSVTASLADSYQWKKNGVNIGGATGTTYTKSNITTADAGNYSVDVTNIFSTTSSNAASIVVNPLPTLAPSPTPATICEGGSVNLTAGGVLNSTPSRILLSENFNAAANGWKTINNSSGGTPANAAWTLRSSIYTYIDPGFNFTFFSSNDTSQFYLSNSQSQGAGTTAAILQSPAVNTMGMSAASLTFYHYYRSNGSGTIKTEASTDGINWTTLTTATTTQGAAAGFVLSTVSLNGYVNQPMVYIRFKYDGSNDYYWAIDNVTITGTMLATPIYSWTSVPAGFTSASQNPTGVFPSGNTTYNVSVTNHYGLSANGSTSVTVNPYVTYYADADGDTYGNINVTQLSCFGAPANYVLDNSDCNDNNAAMHTTFSFYADGDGDGFGFGGTSSQCAINATTPPAGYALNNTDCNDADNTVNAIQAYYADTDGDGFGAGAPNNLCIASAPEGFSADGTDCDDENPETHTTFLFYYDGDKDGYGIGELVSVCAVDAETPPTRYSLINGDCNDEADNAYPGAPEIGYDLIDNDCDGLTDEGFPPKVTVIQSAMCNTTLPLIDSSLIANLVVGAEGYRWRVTTMNGPNAGQVQFLDTAIRTMKITQLASYAFNTTYKIEVGVYYTGFLQPYMESNCTVTTPATTTQLNTCETGLELASVHDAIFANVIPFATGYKFKISDPLNPLVFDELARPIREFRMSSITAFIIQYGKTYNVQTAIRNTDGSYLPYGPICTVTTPLFPTTSVQEAQCDNGGGGPFVVASNTTQIVANSFPGAIAYAFRLVGPGLPPQGAVAINLVRVCTLNDFAGAGLIPGQSYNISVRLIFNWADANGPYGKVCTLTVPGLSKGFAAVSGMQAIVHPNPFSDHFNVAMDTQSKSVVTLKVYDMTGRLLEIKELTPSEMQAFNIGDRYPSGVYNLIVSQDGNTKTTQIIKR
jgi:hypothetical protein